MLEFANLYIGRDGRGVLRLRQSVVEALQAKQPGPSKVPMYLDLRPGDGIVVIKKVTLEHDVEVLG